MKNDTQLRWDMSESIYNPADCPEWARVDVPEWVRPYQGKNGSPEPWHSMEGSVCGGAVRGIDRYQANQYIVFRPETQDYLYDGRAGYTAGGAGYASGTLPSYERVVARYTDPSSMSETEKALALLLKALPEVIRHPDMPPLGESVAKDRNLMDEDLLATGSGWCNEQARVFIRLCQVAGLEGRIIHLFGENHTVAEFYADGRWVMADISWFFVARSAEGDLLSAADCYDAGPGQRAYAKAKKQRFQELLAMSDDELNVSKEAGERHRKAWEAFDADELAGRTDLFFGVINNPLPSEVSAATN